MVRTVQQSLKVGRVIYHDWIHFSFRQLTNSRLPEPNWCFPKLVVNIDIGRFFAARRGRFGRRRIHLGEKFREAVLKLCWCGGMWVRWLGFWCIKFHWVWMTIWEKTTNGWEMTAFQGTWWVVYELVQSNIAGRAALLLVGVSSEAWPGPAHSTPLLSTLKAGLSCTVLQLKTPLLNQWRGTVQNETGESFLSHRYYRQSSRYCFWLGTFDSGLHHCRVSRNTSQLCGQNRQRPGDIETICEALSMLSDDSEILNKKLEAVALCAVGRDLRWLVWGRQREPVDW